MYQLSGNRLQETGWGIVARKNCNDSKRKAKLGSLEIQLIDFKFVQTVQFRMFLLLIVLVFEVINKTPDILQSSKFL